MIVNTEWGAFNNTVSTESLYCRMIRIAKLELAHDAADDAV